MDQALKYFKDNYAKPDFFYYLDALLAAARSVTEVFKKEFNDYPELMMLYRDKKREWKNNNVLRFCKHLRDITLHRHPPGVLTLAGKFDSGKPEIIFSEKGRRRLRIPLHISKSSSRKNQITHEYKIKSFFIKDLPEAFDENLDVMHLLGYYLNELEEFVVEVEEMIERKE